MNRRKSVEPTLVIVPLLFALTLMIASSAWAQSTVRRVAVFSPVGVVEPVVRGLQEGLARLGYKDGKNITFIAEDMNESTSNLASRTVKLLAAKPDAIFAVTTARVLAAKQATATVPIIFALVQEPVELGLVASFASSKNNLTGVVSATDFLSGKRLEVLLDITPKARHLLVILASKEGFPLSSFRFLEQTAKKLRVQLVRRDVTTKEDIKKALRETPKGSVDAIFYIPSTVVQANVHLLIEKAKTDKLPMIAHEVSLAEKGALLSYGADFMSIGVQAARLVAKVLKGEEPSDIPSEVPEKLVLAININTAKAIGLKIPPGVLDRADRLVQ